MRQLPILALLVGAFALPAGAQHGGGARGGGFGGGHMGGGGGFHGGFSGSAPGSHSFSAPGSRGGSLSGSAFRGSPNGALRSGSPRTMRYPSYGLARSPYGAGALRNSPRLPAARPTFYNRYGGSPVAARSGLYRNPYRGGLGRRFSNYGYGYGYGYPGFYPNYVSWNFLDWDLLDWNSLGWNPNTEDYAETPYTDAAAPYAANPAYDAGTQAYAPPQAYAPSQSYAAPQSFAPQSGPQPASEPGFSQPSPLGPVASSGRASLRPEDVITIVFKDGRPPVHARNYALTHNAILLTSPRLHEIPLAEVDLPATERVNAAAGLDFAPPQAP